MNEIAIAIIGIIGGGLIKGYYDHAIAMRQTESKRIESEADLSAEFLRIGTDRDQKSLDRLSKRIETLESRLDSHDQDCDKKIAAAVYKHEKKMSQMRHELNHRIDEISETSIAKQD